MELERFVRCDFTPWAVELSTDRAAEQLKRYGENAWCERLWLDDYRRQRGDGA